MRRIGTAMLVLSIAVAPVPLGLSDATPALAASTPPPPATFVPLASAPVASAVDVPANGTVSVAVAGRAGVPAGAVAVAVNVSVTGTAGGSLTLHPSGTEPPGTTNVTYRPNTYSRVAATSGLGADGGLAMTNRGPAAVVVTLDVQGYAQPNTASPGSVYVPLRPVRIVDTGVGARATLNFTVAGTGGIPASGATAVAVTVTVSTAAVGTATVYPSGGTDPGTPQVEYVPNQIASNFVIVRPGADGKLTLANAGAATASVSVDVAGYFTAPQPTVPGSKLVPLAPQRLRTAVTVAAQSSVPVPAAGQAGMPATDVAAVCVNLTVVGPATAAGSLAAYPTDLFFDPMVTAVRFYPNATSTGSVVAKVHTDGKFRLYNRGTEAVTVSVDASCYFKAPGRPDPPTRVLAAPGDRSASVSWLAPADGGAAVTEYVVTSTPDGRTAAVPGDATTATVTGLANGIAYRFTVRARNVVGLSDPSAPSGQVTPSLPRPPGTPFVTYVYPRDEAVRVTWSPPETGAGSVTGYRVVATPGGAAVQAGPDQTEVVVAGLTNGTAYTFVVTARNGAGEGLASLPSEPVVPSPADPPMAPSALLAVPMDRRIDVQWVAPADGGSAITGYVVTAEPGGHSVGVPADTTVTALTGLDNGTAYTVRVVARNKAGDGTAADQGGLVPAAARPPGAPTDVRAGVPVDGSAAVRWNPPVDTGTSAVTGYTVTAEPGGRSVTASTTTATVTGLDPAVAYRFTVTATNASGTGPASARTDPVTPRLALKATPKVLSGAELAALRMVRTDGSLVFERPPASVTALTAGTVVVLPQHPAAPNGLFRRVTAVSTQGGLVTVGTTPAALTEVFDSGSLAAVSEVGQGEVERFLAESPAIRFKEPTLGGRTLRQGASPMRANGVEIGLRDGHVVAEVTMSVNREPEHDPVRKPSKVPPLGGRLEAHLELDPRLENSVEIGHDVQTFHRISVSYHAQLRAKLGFLRAEEFTLPGARIRARCFDIQVGPVPVIICLEFNVKPKITIDGSVGLTAAVTFGRVIGAEMTTNSGDVTSYRGINESTTGREESELRPYADANITFGLPFETTVYFYDFAGPGLIIRPYVQLRIDTARDPWWEVRVGITLGIFFRTREFFGHQIEFLKEEVVNFFVTVLDAGGPFTGFRVEPRSAETDVGQPVRFHASSATDPEVPVHWRMVSGAGEIDDSGTYRSDLSGNAVVEAYIPADPDHGRDEQAQRAHVRVRGTTVPGLPGDVTAQARALGAQLTWKPPVTDGNLPIVQYAVVSTPPTGTTYVPAPATGVRLRSLKAGVAYTFRVYALNAIGRSEASNSTEPVTPYEAVRPNGPVADVAVDADGVPDTSGVAGRDSSAFVSGDGRYVFFSTVAASNLAPPEVYNPASRDQYLLRKDRFTGEIALASHGIDGVTPARASVGPAAGLNARTYLDAASNYDGTVVAYIAGTGDPTRVDLLVYDFDAHTTTNVTQTLPANGGRHVVLSRSGTTVAFDQRTDSQEKHLYTSTGGSLPHRIDRCHFDPACPGLVATNFDMTGDGAVVYYADQVPGGARMHVYRQLVATGEERDLSAPPGDMAEAAHTVTVSSDGTTLAAAYFRCCTAEIPRGETGLLVKPTGTGAPLNPADIVVPNPNGTGVDWLNPTDVSEDGGVVAYLFRTSTAERAYLYDVVDATIIPIQEAPEFDVRDMTMADSATVAIWLRCRRTGTRCDFVSGVWAQALT